MTELLGALVTQAGPAGAGGGPAGPASILGSPIFMLVLMFVVIYMLMIRPQQKKAKEHRDYLQRLNRGDQVITNSGIMGKVISIADALVTLEVAKDVRIRILKSQIAGPQGPQTSTDEEKGGKRS